MFVLAQIAELAEDTDEATLFAQSLIPQLKRLSPYQLGIVKQQFNSILFNMEFNEPSLLMPPEQFSQPSYEQL
jgi:hypothetical protein